jgi:hypothetical protein
MDNVLRNQGRIALAIFRRQLSICNVHFAFRGDTFVLHGDAHTRSSIPAKPIRIAVGFAAGGASDVAARLLAPKIEPRCSVSR